MKTFNFFKLSLFAVLICLSACSTDDSIESEGIILDSDIANYGLYFSNEKNEKSITFSTSENWTLSIEEASRGVNWCKISAESGRKGTSTVTFTVEENPSFYVRNAFVTIKSGIITKKFSLSQKAAPIIPGTLMHGELFRETIYCLANGLEGPGENVDITQMLPDSIIERIVVELNNPATPVGNYAVVSSEQSVCPVYAIWDNEKQITLRTKGNMLYVHQGASHMFYGLKKLTFCDLPKMNTSDVKYMWAMFKECGLSSLDLSKFYTSEVLNMNELFAGCSNLTTLDVSSFDTSNVRTMYNMFGGCKNLTTLDVSHFNTSNVTDMTCMFIGCGVSSLDLKGFDTSKVTSMAGMFSNCDNLTTLDVSSFDTSNVTSMIGMFNCKKLTKLDVSNFDTSNVTEMQAMFSSCENISELDLSGFNTSKVVDMSWMFGGCEKLTTVKWGDFDTSGVKYMTGMFTGCMNLKSLDLNVFNTSRVKDMGNMFYYCTSLTTLDIRNFDTSNVTNMDSMFANCTQLNTLDLSSFSFANTPTVSHMFTDIGINVGTTSIIISEDGYNYLARQIHDNSVKFVKSDGSDW